MRITACGLALLLAAPGRALPAQGVEEDPAPVTEQLPPVTVTAPRVDERRALENARAGGATAAGFGAGLMSYVVLFGGPFGWGAALLYLGGMTSYLSDRRLEGVEDLSPRRVPAPAPADEPVTAPVLRYQPPPPPSHLRGF